MSVSPQTLYVLQCDTCNATLTRTDLPPPSPHQAPHRFTTAQHAISAAIADAWLVTPTLIECPKCQPKTRHPDQEN